jgi:hypothetical protein
METAAVRLKRLRDSTHPRLSIRRLSEELGIAPSSYAFYEDPKKFKKQYLPVGFAKAVAKPLSTHGVAVADVLALAGIEQEAPEPSEGKLTSRSASLSGHLRTDDQVIPMGVVLPSEAALARMFEGLLRPLDLAAPKDELARILAQRLPNGLARLASVLPSEATGQATAPDAAPPPPATDHPVSQPGSRT